MPPSRQAEPRAGARPLPAGTPGMKPGGGARPRRSPPSLPRRRGPFKRAPPPPSRALHQARARRRPARGGAPRPAPPLPSPAARTGWTGPARRARPRGSRVVPARLHIAAAAGLGEFPRRGGGAQMATQVEALLPGAPPLLPAEERALVLKPPQDGGREKGEPPMGPDGGPAAPRPPSAKQQKEESNNQEKESLLRAGGEAEDGGEAGGAGRREFIEAPPPKVNPWTKNAPAAAPAVNGQSPPGGCPGPGAGGKVGAGLAGGKSEGGEVGCAADRAPAGRAMRHGVGTAPRLRPAGQRGCGRREGSAAAGEGGGCACGGGAVCVRGTEAGGIRWK